MLQRPPTPHLVLVPDLFTFFYVHPFLTEKGHDWLLGSFLFGIEIGGGMGWDWIVGTGGGTSEKNHSVWWCWWISPSLELTGHIRPFIITSIARQMTTIKMMTMMMMLMMCLPLVCHQVSRDVIQLPLHTLQSMWLMICQSVISNLLGINTRQDPLFL